jgi:hypothetical protein
MVTKHSSKSERISLMALAALALFGVLLQLILSIRLSQANNQSIANGLIVYFGYFTVLTNIFIASVASARLARKKSRLSSETVRGCATTAILFVGIAYHFLLRNVWSPEGWQWVADFILHYAVPLVSLAYWLVFPPRDRLRITAPIIWGLYPLVYIVYVLLRAEFIGSYPYHFIDVKQIGYASVLTNALGLLLCFVFFGFVVYFIARLRD